MGNTNYEIIYRGYSDADLAVEIASLRTQMQNPFTSQSANGQSASRSLESITARLTGAQKVATERGRVGGARTFVQFK